MSGRAQSMRVQRWLTNIEGSSFKNLHQWALIALLYGVQPFCFVFQVQHVQGHHAVLLGVVGPDRSRRVGNNAGQGRQSVRIMYAQRDLDESRSRSEERRVGTEDVSTCSSRWSRYNYKKTRNTYEYKNKQTSK